MNDGRHPKSTPPSAQAPPPSTLSSQSPSLPSEQSSDTPPPLPPSTSISLTRPRLPSLSLEDVQSLTISSPKPPPMTTSHHLTCANTEPLPSTGRRGHDVAPPPERGLAQAPPPQVPPTVYQCGQSQRPSHSLPPLSSSGDILTAASPPQLPPASQHTVIRQSYSSPERPLPSSLPQAPAEPLTLRNLSAPPDFQYPSSQPGHSSDGSLFIQHTHMLPSSGQTSRTAVSSSQLPPPLTYAEPQQGYHPTRSDISHVPPPSIYSSSSSSSSSSEGQAMTTVPPRQHPSSSSSHYPAYTDPSHVQSLQQGHALPRPSPAHPSVTNQPHSYTTLQQHVPLQRYTDPRAFAPGYSSASPPYSPQLHGASSGEFRGPNIAMSAQSAGYGMPSNHHHLTQQQQPFAYGNYDTHAPVASTNYSYTTGGVGGVSNPPHHPIGYVSTGNAAPVAGTHFSQLPPYPLHGSGVSRPRVYKKVFILYCKDRHLPQTFSDEVLDLADILSHCGGFTCTVDHYVDVHPANWDLWTQQRIEESQYVLFVCSPSLAHHLRDPGDSILVMEKGKYYVSSIVNYVKPQKFIPVFLNQYVPRSYLDWVPSQLHASAVYGLNISELRSVLDVPAGTPRHVFDQQLGTALSDDRFREVTKLVNHLRDETATSPPVPPDIPIPTPGHTPHLPHPQYSTPTPTTRPGLYEHIPDSSFETIAERMPRDWFALGVRLGVDTRQLQNLRKKHAYNHVPAALEMFGLWQQTKGRLATRKALKDALMRMEYGRLAKELFPNV